jgi:SAM-dependent methyltransferase
LSSDKPVTDATKSTQSLNDHTFASLLPLLACPECRGDLARQGAGLTCQSCSRSYEVADGIPLLAQAGSSELWGVESGSQTSTAYQETFLDAGIGGRYQERYERRWGKRFTTRREIGRIEQLLLSQPRCQRLLDIPCGGGRVSGPLVKATDLLLQADISLSQVLTARQTMGSQGSFAWLTASAFLIPLKEGVVDGILCNRLAHHLAGVEQERLIGELLRVSKRFVILSYYDYDSFKSRSRRLRGKKPGFTLRRPDLDAMAKRHGASVAMDLPLWVSGSRLRFALLLKSSTN